MTLAYHYDAFTYWFKLVYVNVVLPHKKRMIIQHVTKAGYEPLVLDKHQISFLLDLQYHNLNATKQFQYVLECNGN